MKLRLAALALILVGVGSVVFVVVGPSLPSFGGSSSSKYITSTVSTGTVTQASVATGTVAASTVYGLKFGVNPDIVSSSSTTSGAGGTTSNAGGNTTSGSGNLTWPVQTVSVKVGDRVTKGQVLATAQDTAAKLALVSAQATLDSATSKYQIDQNPSALTVAQAKNQLSQSYSSYQQAVASRTNTYAQNTLTLNQAQAAFNTAQANLDSDPTNVSLQNQLASAEQNLASVQLKVSQSNQQAAQQVTNASLSYQAAQLTYQSKISPASNSTLLADQAQVANAQAAADAAQQAVTGASMVAPADGLIIAVNILPGVNAPSGYAIEISVGPMVATASFAEADITKLKVGQAATVSVTAASTSVVGVLSQIVPAASTTSSGQQSSVVTYAVTVTLTAPPATVLAGMTATITVTTATVDNVIRVPATALSGSSASGYTVQVVNGDGSVSTATVQVGLVTSTYVQVTGGLAAGQAVVTGTSTSRTGTTTSNGGVNINSLTGGNNFGPGR
jgi:multidrug efflux pump subunit AcrA (membrane-fusion protein)